MICIVTYMYSIPALLKGRHFNCEGFSHLKKSTFVAIRLRLQLKCGLCAKLTYAN